MVRTKLMTKDEDRHTAQTVLVFLTAPLGMLLCVALIVAL